MQFIFFLELWPWHIHRGHGFHTFVNWNMPVSDCRWAPIHANAQMSSSRCFHLCVHAAIYTHVFRDQSWLLLVSALLHQEQGIDPSISQLMMTFRPPAARSPCKPALKQGGCTSSLTDTLLEGFSGRLAFAAVCSMIQWDLPAAAPPSPHPQGAHLCPG